MLLGWVGGIIPQILLPSRGAAGAPNPGIVPGVTFGCAAPRASCGSCREPAALQRSEVPVLLAALYHRSVPASQAKQGTVSLYYIRLHSALYHKTDR